jgi:hypothetical protein
MDEKKNIYFFLPNFKIGGASTSILNICKKVQNKNNNIHVISLGKNYYKNYFRKISVNIIELESKKTIFAIFDILSILKKKSKKKKIIFVSNINYANVLSCIFLKNLKNLKLILIERTPLQELKIFFNFTDLIKKKIIYNLIKVFYRRADIIIGNSIDVSSYIKKKIGLSAKTINPIINRKIIKKKYNKNLQLTWIGRDSNEKRVIDFLKSLKFIENKKIIINIVSDQNIRLKYKYLIYKKNINKINYYKFNIHRKFVNKIYKKTDIYVNTSLFEGFPNTIADAVINKCLVIASDSYGGTRDIIRNNNFGLIYKAKDYLDLSRCINFAIKNFDVCKKKILKANKELLKKSLENNKQYKKFFEKI